VNVTTPQDELDAIDALPIVRGFLARVEQDHSTVRNLQGSGLRIHPIDRDYAIAIVVERGRISIAMDPDRAASNRDAVSGAWLGAKSYRTQLMHINAPDIGPSLDRIVELAGEALDWTVEDRRRPGEQNRREGAATAVNPRCDKHGYELQPNGSCWRCVEDGG
jgi:hypothetical protein